MLQQETSRMTSAPILFLLHNGVLIVSIRTIWHTIQQRRGFCRYHFLQNRIPLRFFTTWEYRNIRSSTV